MYRDYKDLLSAFHAHGVKYLIVGGYAVLGVMPLLFIHSLVLRETSTSSRKQTLLMRKLFMPRSPLSAHRWKEFARKTSRRAGVSFALDAIRMVLTFFPASLASILTRRGNGVSTVLLTPRLDSKLISFQVVTL